MKLTEQVVKSSGEEGVVSPVSRALLANVTSCRIHSATEAEAFYRSECTRVGINVNNAFLRQLQVGLSVFNFDNGYLGERGIIPVFSTIQRLSVAGLSMKGCKLSADDIAEMVQFLSFHETLQRIDLRDVPLSVSSGRKLLALAARNSALTEIVVDEDTPKYLSIQRQCFSNANVKLVASRCLVCNRAVIYSPDQRVEGQILLALSKSLMGRGERYCEDALEVLFRTLLTCCDTNNGVLFLCSFECKNKLSDDIMTMIESVLSELLHGVRGPYPRNAILQRCLIDNVTRLNKRRAAQKKLNGDCRTKLPSTAALVSAGTTECYESSSNESSDSEEVRKRNFQNAETCSVCGCQTCCLTDGAYRFLSQLHSDVSIDCFLRPSALLHLSRVMIKHEKLKPCSQVCVEHLVRFGLYSYGGVHAANSMVGGSLLSSLDIPLRQLSNEDFAIVNFGSVHIDDTCGEDTCCALTVASAMTDIEGVVIDPYMLYAVGRFLAKIPPTSLGMELRHACEAAMFIGCLPVSSAPFDRRKARPTRDLYYLWEKWCEVGDMETIVRASFSRRRQGLFIVDGPHSNLFDNTRAVLWAFRKMRRAVLIVMLFCVEWLTLPNGVVPNESTMGRSFHTTFKVVGQTNIHNTIYVICQGNFGASVGNRGFFYIPRSIFNLYVSGDACIFVDSNVFALGNSGEISLHASRFLPKRTVGLVDSCHLLLEAFNYTGELCLSACRGALDGETIFSEAIFSPPALLFFAYRASECHVSPKQWKLLRTLRQLCLTDGARSLVLFYLTEVLGPKAVEWIRLILHDLAHLPPHPTLLLNGTGSANRDNVGHRKCDIEWNQVMGLLSRSATMLTLSTSSRLEHMERKVAPKRGSQLANRKKEATPVAQDPFHEDLLAMWSFMRRETEEQKQMEGTCRGRGCRFMLPLPAQSEKGVSVRMLAQDPDVVSPELIGEVWHCVCLCTEDGKLTGFAMFFVRDRVCCFNVQNHSMNIPLRPISEMLGLEKFPFIGGFDCAFNSPVNPRTAYFFCGQEWTEWDSYRQRCGSGLFKLRYHKQFRALPERFLNGVSAAVPVPNTSLVFFFCQLEYVILDITRGCLVSGVMRTGECNQGVAGDVAFGPELSKVFPHGPMTTMLLWDRGGIAKSRSKVESSGTEESTLSMRSTTEDCGERASGGDIEVKKRPASGCGVMAVVLIGHCGRVAIVKDFRYVSGVKCEVQFETIPSSMFSRLPVVFRQNTMTALSGICKIVLQKECGVHNVVLSDVSQIARKGCIITSTLTQVAESAGDLLSLSLHESSTTFPPLLCESAIFVQTEESLLGDSYQTIEVRYSDMNPGAFGALVIVLNLSCIEPRVLRIAPVEAVVESSDDGITYVRHAHFFIMSAVTPVCWGVSHVGLTWRVRFLSKLPVGAGVVRLLLHEVVHVLGTVPVDPVVTLAPSESTLITIDAPSVLAPAKDILSCLTPGAVFTTFTDKGWCERHCILPLLPSGDFCLLFCGSHFVELDYTNSVVVGHRAVSLATHPAFAALPQPFSRGFNAAFYPNVRNPNIVAFVYESHLILWDIEKGALASGGLSHNAATMFRGLPWKMEEVEDIVQIWDKPEEVFIIKSPQVIRWSLATSEIMEGPMTLRNSAYFYHPEFEGRPILCATSFPRDPMRFYTFCDDRVAVFSTNAPGITHREEARPVCQSSTFYPVAWYLAWGKRRHDCIIHIDFRYEQRLLVGMAMQSSEPCNDSWDVEYSDDGVVWRAVQKHHQSSGYSRTIWGSECAGNRSQRLWRFTLECPEGSDRRECPVLYFHLSLLTIPSASSRGLPSRIACSGTLSGPMSSLFVDDKLTVAFDNPVDEMDNKQVTTQHLIVDYGEKDPADLMEFSCVCLGKPRPVKWIISCSSNGEQWETCGTWHSVDHSFRAAWHPRGPRRFWSVELETREPSTVYENLTFFEHVGPLIYFEDTLSLGCLLDPFVLCDVGPSCIGVASVVVPMEVGSSIILDSKQNAIQVVGVYMSCSGNSSPCTTFLVECSTDGFEWLSVGAAFTLRGDSAQAAWKVANHCRYWRLRVTEHVGVSPLRICSIRFDTPRPTLYRRVEAPRNSSVASTGMELNLGGNFSEVVAVEAELPPNSLYIVEKRSFDGSSWETVARLQNEDASTARKVRQGWKPRGASSHWRLRSSVEDDDGDKTVLSARTGSPTFEQKEDEIQAEWYTFVGKMFTRYEFSNSPNVTAVAEGFEEMLSPMCLSDNSSHTVVLRSREMGTEASVAWHFGGDGSPCFKQVFVNCRVVTNPAAMETLEKLVVSEGPSVVSPPQSKRCRKRSSKTLVIQQEDVVKVVEMEEETLSIIIETSNNGIDYVPVAERFLTFEGNLLSFAAGMPTSHWRVRFKGIPKTSFLELLEVIWSLEKGVATRLSTDVMCPLTDSMCETWQNAAFSHEEEFCRQCRAGYDQARSVVSGLREPTDIERHGRVAQQFMRFRSEFMAFQNKVFRKASKAKNLPENKFISTERKTGYDFMYLLHMAAEKYSCGVDKLNMLIANPMSVVRDFSIEKESLSWFYPKIVEGGTLSESFYGFHNARAFIIILWSMSLYVQRNTDMLTVRKINPLNEHVASVMVLVEIKESNWLAIEHFPQLPFLYHVGFSGQPLIVAFTLNSLVFTPKYRMTFPGSHPVPLNHPMQLFPGVNFIRRASLASCPCPIFDRLRMLYTSQFLQNMKTEIILSAPTMSSSSAIVRFTLPGNDINFGLRGLVVGYMVFEVEFFLKNAIGNSPLLITEHQRINFVSYDTVFDVGESTIPIIELTLSGSISYHDEEIFVSGVSPSARYDMGSVFAHSFISDLKISFNAVVGNQPQSFLQPTVNMGGILVVPGCGSFACRLTRVNLNRRFESFSMEVSEMQLADLIILSNKLVGDASSDVDVSWMRGVPMYFSVELRLNHHERRLIGEGTVKLDGIQGDVFVNLSPHGFGASGNFQRVRIGAIYLQGKDDSHHVLVNVSSLVSGYMSIRLEGHCCLLTPRPSPMRVEVSQKGVVCISSGVFYDVCIEEDSVFPSKMYANVILSKGLLSSYIEEELREEPLVTALLAKGVEFSFVVDDVLVPQCMLERQLMFITVRGVLMGCYFDVTVSVFQPDNTTAAARKASKEFLPLIIEQCDMPLWSLYHMFVGCVGKRKFTVAAGDADDVDDNRSDASSVSAEDSTSHVRGGGTPQKHGDGVFLARWQQRERSMFEENL